MTRLVITLGGGGRITPATEEPLKDLQSRLNGPKMEVRVISQEPEGYGIIWGEVVVIYVAMKALDKLTDDALDALFSRLVDVAKKWARERVEERINRGDQRVRATHVEPRDETGRQVGPSVSAKQGAGGEVEVTVSPVGDDDIRSPVQFDPSWLEEHDDDGSGGDDPEPH